MAAMESETQIVPSTAPLSASDRELLADRVIAAFAEAFAKLAEHRTEILLLWREFENLKPGETIKGCHTKTEFAERHLGRTIRAVQYMLAGGNKNKRRREIISRGFFEQRLYDQGFVSKCGDLVLRALVIEQARLIDQMEGACSDKSSELLLQAARLEGEVEAHLMRRARLEEAFSQVSAS